MPKTGPTQRGARAGPDGCDAPPFCHGYLNAPHIFIESAAVYQSEGGRQSPSMGTCPIGPKTFGGGSKWLELIE
jgi:hypothetical protein